MGDRNAPAAPEGDADRRDRAAVLALLAPVTVIAGHYGVGKTNLALNLALDAAATGYEVILADLDVVNPYFRSTEYRAALEAAGVRLVAPVFAEAGASLDVPSLTGGVEAALAEAYARAAKEAPTTPSAASEEAPRSPQAQRDHAKGTSRLWLEATTRRAEPGASGGPDDREDHEDSAPRPLRLIIDVGGDDVGAAALGRFAPAVKAGPHALWYVANPYRNLTAGAEGALEVLREVEAKARLAASAVVANPHLKAETDAFTVADALPTARAVAEEAGLPLAFVTAPKRLARRERDELRAQAQDAFVYPVDVVVRTPWETES